MGSKQHRYSCLYSFIAVLEAGEAEIASKWLSDSRIKKIFLDHRISIEKFKLNYAPGIIRYFIEVIKEEKLLGDCPIMSKFVNYMLSKGIAPHEVYDICTSFRKELTEHIISFKEMSSQESVDTLNEIAIVFDANFSGVLTLFSEVLNRQTSTIKKSIEYKKKFQNLVTLIDVLDVKVFVVQSRSIIVANSLLLKSLGVEDLEDLHLKFSDTLSFLQEISYKKELFNYETYEVWMQKAAKTKKKIIATVFDPNSRKEVPYKVSVDILPESKPTKYVFTLQESILSELNTESLVPMVDKLTGLISYTYFKINRNTLLERLDKSQHAFIVVDIKSLRKTNESFGYEKGDRLLIDVAKKIKSMSDGSMLNIRLSGSRIGILFSQSSTQKLYDWSVNLRYELETISDENYVALTLYKKEDSSNQVELRAYSLLESIDDYSNKKHVLTDIKDIDAYDILENQEMFFNRFSKLKEPIEGAVLFHEIVVKAKNKIVRIDRNSLYLNVSIKQLSVAKSGSPFYLYSNELGHIRATINSVNHERSIVELSRFSFDEHTPLKRKMLRVTADSSLEIQLIDDDVNMDVEVLYLNEEYISFKLSRKRALKIGKLVYMEMSIHDEYLEVEGSVHMLQKSLDGYKCVVQIHHTSDSSSILQKYIATRQLQIIQELNSL